MAGNMSAEINSDLRHHGRCYCGQVDYTVSGPLRDVVDCHCERCRRITGHHIAATQIDRANLTLNQSSTLQWFHPDDDPNVGYGFCSNCGSSMFWRESDTCEQWSICAGTLDHPTGMKTSLILFADEAADYHRLDPDIEKLATE